MIVRVRGRHFFVLPLLSSFCTCLPCSLKQQGAMLLRGGSSGMNDIGAIEAGSVFSTMANPQFAQIKAFVPKEAPHRGTVGRKNSTDLHVSKSQEIVDLGKYAWFYPDPPWGRKNVFRPGSMFLQVWDGTVWLAMMYIAFNVPFRAAGFTMDDWDEDHCSLPKNMLAENLARPLRSIVDLIFLTDIIFSMHTAFYQYRGNGRLDLVDDLPTIRNRYLSSWAFVWDVCGIFPLKAMACLISYLIPGSIPFIWDNKVINLFKAFRMAKLFRLHHIYRIANFIAYKFPDKSRLFNLSLLLGQMLFTGHVLACAWYFVGQLDRLNGWVVRHTRRDESCLSKYVKSFYFIYATITTVGYGDVAGLNAAERIFCIGLMVLGGFLFGHLIGSVPAIIDRRSEAGARYLELENRLKEYMKDKQVPAALQARIMQFFEYRYPERRSFDGYKIIQDLPLSMQKDLAAHVHRNLVTACPILKRCSAGTTGEICLLLRKTFAAEGDVITIEGTPSNGLCFVKSGQVLLSRGWESESVLGPGGVFGENCVNGGDGTLKQSHTATALEPVELYILLRPDLEDLVANRPDFIPTYDLDSWEQVKRNLLSRRETRLGLDKLRQVLGDLGELREQIRDLTRDQQTRLERHRGNEGR
uniref:Cyclic nucleotide-binding domain-containing protein n=1 Tax=Guillardia theta TaxID=55529 RepID=A0A7S4U666_GUITH|mmetsp:Transcript_42316/g.133312  ORF Transcript_42316/g.133312 Transcript_42316/m.133312 type:complete len:639 (+) Transcript_42316:187-2103(+)